MGVDLLDREQTAAVWRSRFLQSAQLRLSDNDFSGSRTDTDRLSLNRSEPANKSGQNISKNRCRTIVAEPIGENASGTALYRGSGRLCAGAGLPVILCFRVPIHSVGL